MDTRGKRIKPVQYVPAAGPQKGPKKRHSTEGNTPAAGPQKGPPKRHSTEGNTPAAGQQKGPPKRHSSEGNTPAAGPQKPKKKQEKTETAIITQSGTDYEWISINEGLAWSTIRSQPGWIRRMLWISRNTKSISSL
jgi:hypothetical protein